MCTASTPKNIALAYERFGIDRKVQTTVSPADGLRGKPHPDIFAEAARRLGVAPAEPAWCSRTRRWASRPRAAPA